MIEFFTDIYRKLRGQIEDYGDPDYRAGGWRADYDERDSNIRH